MISTKNPMIRMLVRTRVTFRAGRGSSDQIPPNPDSCFPVGRSFNGTPGRVGWRCCHDPSREGRWGDSSLSALLGRLCLAPSGQCRGGATYVRRRSGLVFACGKTLNPSSLMSWFHASAQPLRLHR